MPGRRLVAAVLVAAALVGCGGGDGGGTSLPEAPLQRVGGDPVSLAEGTGRPTVVNLWATWCVPCRRELPAFDEVAGAAGDAVAIYGVNVGDDADDARDLVEELDLSFPQLLDPDSELSAALGVVQMPTTAFLDATSTGLQNLLSWLQPNFFSAAPVVGVETPEGTGPDPQKCVIRRAGARSETDG